MTFFYFDICFVGVCVCVCICVRAREKALYVKYGFKLCMTVIVTYIELFSHSFRIRGREDRRGREME